MTGFNTFWYCFKQGLKSIKRNILFSMASIATVAACIFLFSLFYSIVMNVQHITKEAETTVGITVFFDEGLSDEQKSAIGDMIKEKPGIKELRYISAEEAWDSFKTDYFGDDSEELAEAFADDNPLATSDNYEIFLENISDQQAMVQYIESLDGVREVNYSNAVVSAMSGMNRIISILSGAIIAVLIAVAIFLISNTISVAAAFRKRENEIMKLIGATNFMIRAPFVVEGVIIGFVGALIPVAAMYFIYKRAAAYVIEHYLQYTRLFEMIPLNEIFPAIVAVAMTLGVGMGFLVSFFTIRKHLKV
ncbi:MAG: permease-like cell division protein FtsX [Candidatus Avilachnospira sp.]|jgi:cell division transport system permease protein